ncbi:MAG TPA: DUF116 domain-containing protein [Archaeoglobaceae archaeon]|nr:DUF116 domain-containing protein [Archaeoglobaceae archaeon]
MGIDTIISKLFAIGADLSTRNAVQRALSLISEDGDLVDQIYVAIKNRANQDSFSSTPISQRALFLPACLRNKKCESELTDEGYVCKRCGKCVISEIIEYAENLGYSMIFIVPGGSLVIKILKDRMRKGEIKAAAGVACHTELAEASEKLSMWKVPHQCVPLLKSGCVDTIVDVNEVKYVLGMNRTK